MDEFQEIGNDNVLVKYSENIEEAFTVNLDGDKVADLRTDKDNIELCRQLQAPGHSDQESRRGHASRLQIQVRSDRDTHLRCGPLGSCLGIHRPSTRTTAPFSAYISTTAARLRDSVRRLRTTLNFQAQFIGKSFNLENAANPFDIVKGGAPEGDMHAVDAISGSTMTCRGLDVGIDLWIGAYSNYLVKAAAAGNATAEASTAMEE